MLYRPRRVPGIVLQSPGSPCRIDVFCTRAYDGPIALPTPGLWSLETPGILLPNSPRKDNQRSLTGFINPTDEFRRRARMRKFLFLNFMLGIVAVIGVAAVLHSAAMAHEAHKTQCTQASINAIRADIQVMKDGEAKKTAVAEMKLAEDMMASKDKEGCVSHMHKAMEAIEE